MLRYYQLKKKQARKTQEVNTQSITMELLSEIR